MPQQTINIGAAPDDGTGDTLRVGGDKINDNFTELYAADAALGTAAALDVDPDDTLAADSDSLIPTQQAVKAYVDANIGTPITELDDIPDVNAPTPANGDVLTWDSTPGEWVPAAPTGGANALDDLTDVDAPTPSDGDVLTFDSGSGDWVPAAPTGGASFRGALVKKAADQTTANYSTGVAIAWDNEGTGCYDTDSIHDTVTNNSRLTVPSGVTYVELAYCVSCTLVTGGSDTYTHLRKNGSLMTAPGNPMMSIDTASATTVRLNGKSPVLPVTAGDYFEVELSCADNSITVDASFSWFAMRIIA